MSAVISAPRRRSEVRENLAALANPTMSVEQLAELRAHGIGVRAENQRFQHAPSPTDPRCRPPPRASCCASELPPSDDTQRALPRPSTARPARTNLGKTRTRAADTIADARDGQELAFCPCRPRLCAAEQVAPVSGRVTVELPGTRTELAFCPWRYVTADLDRS